MQTIVSTFIVIIAVLYIANLWMPHKTKQRLLRLIGKQAPSKKRSACGACSSCNGCGSNEPG